MKYEAIKEYSHIFDVKKMCEVLGVKRGSYYSWIRNEGRRNERRAAEQKDIAEIEMVFEASDRIYGYRNIAMELKEKGHEISEYRVRRLMKENGLYPELAVKFRPVHNGKSDGRYFRNIVSQDFDVSEKNKIWAGDITYIKTRIGWVYLEVVMDLYNREIIGYELGKRMDTQLMTSALGNAISKRGCRKGLVFHSDRGCQYSSRAYQKVEKENGITGSMSRPGCPYDNSCVESFFASLKKEKIYRREYDTIKEVRKDIFWYIELFYNRKHRHKALGHMSPVEYRRKYDELDAA